MNRYNLPVWYIKYWDFLCRIQQFKEDKNRIVGYLWCSNWVFDSLERYGNSHKGTSKNMMAIVQEFVNEAH